MIPIIAAALVATLAVHVLIHTIWDWVDARRENQP